MLSSWKEIAHFFGKGVRTVQRWEKTLDLPIHRPPGAPSNVVLARTSDLEEWMHRGPVPRPATDGSAVGQDAVTVALTGLESELALLADLIDFPIPSIPAGTNTPERLVALTSFVGQVNAHLSQREEHSTHSDAARAA